MDTTPTRRRTDLDAVTLRVILVCVTTAFAVVWVSLLILVIVGAATVDEVSRLFTLLVGLLAGWLAPGPSSLGLLPRSNN